MKRAFKIIGYVLGGLVGLVLCAWLYLELTWKKSYASIPLPDITASKDPEIIARGDYLVHAVAHCSICHQPAEGLKAGSAGGTDLVGGFEWQAGPFGNFYAANITSDQQTGVGALSDGELARIIRHGVRKDGSQAVFMSFAVGPMADEDVMAVISYLRTLPPIAQQNPTDDVKLIGKVVMKNFSPRETPPPKWVAPGGISVERGAYLANGPAVCIGCHTDWDVMNGFAQVGASFSGSTMADPDHTDPSYEIVAPNLTPDPETGHITQWSEDAFVARFKGGSVFPGSKMPWPNFANMTEDDVRSIYRYLHTLPPTKKAIGATRRPKS